MKKRPKVFTGLAIALFMIAGSFPIQIMVMFGTTPLEFGAIVHKLSPLNWIVLGLAISLGVLLMRASRWVLVVAPAFLVTMAWNNWLVSEVDVDVSATMTLLATGVVFLAFASLFTKSARNILANQALRWWLTPPRRRMSVKTRVCPVVGGELISTTFDLSTNGTFISLRDASWAPAKGASLKNLDVGNHCSLRLVLDQLRVLTCTGEVVRQSAARGHYPSGFAVRFVGLNKRQKQMLSEYIQTQMENREQAAA
jgi:hypothetical protein